jgi:O-antigen/teichoic acid export membrane protein
MFNEQVLTTVVQPTIADLQREIAKADPGERLRARWRGYRAFWTIVLLSPFVSVASPAGTVRGIAVPDAIARVATASIVVALIAIVGPALGAGAAIVAGIGGLFAIVLHAWHAKHPSDIPTPDEPQRATPQINFSSTEVAGNVGGLIFVVGSVFIVAIGLPSVIWFLFAAAIAGCFVAWALVAWHTRHPKSGLPKNWIVLR